MTKLLLDPNRHRQPQMLSAGWWASRVYEFLFVVSAKYNLNGKLPANYADPKWLAEEWDYRQRDCVEGEIISPAESISYALFRLQDHELIKRDGLGGIEIAGWDKSLVLTKDLGYDIFSGVDADKAVDSGQILASKSLTASLVPTGEQPPDVSPSTTVDKASAVEVPPSSIPPTAVKALQTLWNEILKPPVPRWLATSGPRLRSAKARLSENSDLEHWRKVFERIHASDFLTGRSGKWVASIDFALSPGRDIAILEGKYDNVAASSTPSEQPLKTSIAGLYD